MENSVNPNHNTSCPNCRAEFTCEIAAGKDHCWCFDLPRAAYVDLSAIDACRCPECVAKQIEVAPAIILQGVPKNPAKEGSSEQAETHR